MSTHPHSKVSRLSLNLRLGLLCMRCKDCSKEIRDGSLGCGPASWEISIAKKCRSFAEKLHLFHCDSWMRTPRQGGTAVRVSVHFLGRRDDAGR